MARRDARPLIYGVLDQLFAIAYAVGLVAVFPNRNTMAAIHLWTLPVLMQVMAVGTLLVLVPRARRVGWWMAIAAGSAVLLATVLLIVRVLVSAAFLAGVYGAFGKGAATTALVVVALIVELVALVPVLQVKYLMSRAGRRAYT